MAEDESQDTEIKDDENTEGDGGEEGDDGSEEKDPEEGGGDDNKEPSEGKDEGHKEALIEFWNLHQGELEEIVAPTKEYIESKISEIKQLGDLILEWIALGDLVMQNISKALQIYDFPDSKLEVETDVYEKLKEHLDFIEPFSPELVTLVDVVETVKPNYAPDVFPPPPIIEKEEFAGDNEYEPSGSIEISRPADFIPLAEAIKKEVIEKMDVKGQSEEIYKQLEEIFSTMNSDDDEEEDTEEKEEETE